MRVGECMTRDVRLAGPDQTIGEAAMIMAEIDAGALPVGDGDRLVGMLTDRDIAVRAVAQGMGPDTRVRDVMSSDIKYCFNDDDVDEVIDNMGDIKVRRLVVLDRDKRMVGIISLGDLAKDGPTAQTGAALNQICRPGGDHSQAAH
ncbi:CBS domain-containing protein [Phenylobacterium sp.]|uniref:CBS domain-containing protein n=1 Tax=Phenylobacterium sp. TaxID=1871053 RepID=UPI00262A72AE|nr:CBS domain-containing protein [Phenylobacterium sp.]